MIKMSAYNPKTKTDFNVIGLSDNNLRLLREGKPIMIHGAEWGKAFDLMIFWGETEEKLTEMVQPFIGPETVVRDEVTNRPKKN
jgi:hypothetical protein